MNIDQIIAKVFSGKATQEELAALNVWKAEAEENIKAIKEMQSIDQTLEDTADYKEYDVDAAWTAMENSMASTSTEQQEQTASGKVVKLSWMKQAAAACAILILSIVGWQMYTSTDTTRTDATYLTAAEEVLSHTLSDGSMVTLDTASTLQQIDSRSVRLSGRAYFDIAQKEGKQFTIATAAGRVTVLGTRFTVDTRPAHFSIFVTEGKVRYDFRTHKIELTAGDRLTMYDGDPLVVKANATDMNSWMSPKLRFQDEPLSAVVPQIMARYGKTIVIDNPKTVAKCRVNTTFSTETFADVLNELSATLGLKYHNIDGVIHIVASTC